jgi:hypothetical protein
MHRARCTVCDHTSGAVMLAPQCAANDDHYLTKKDYSLCDYTMRFQAQTLLMLWPSRQEKQLMKANDGSGSQAQTDEQKRCSSDIIATKA